VLLAGFPSAYKQWGISNENETLILPIAANLIAIVGMHEGVSLRPETYSMKTNKWLGTSGGYTIFYVAICK
jgi:hypothetical protein